MKEEYTGDWIFVHKGKGRQRQREPWDSKVKGRRHWKSMQHLGCAFLGRGSALRLLFVNDQKPNL